MWITGFDVPTCSTIYLDKPMQAHTLMQTIARANRVAPGKESGLIVDYVGIFRALQKALAIYARPAPGKEPAEPIVSKDALVTALRAALVEADGFCAARGIKLDAIAAAQGYTRVGLIGDAVEALLQSDATKKAYLQGADRVARLFKAILPDPAATELAPQAVLVSYLAATIRAKTEQPDFSAVMSDVETLLNDSIATEGFRIGPASKPEALVNLSEIDFAALQEKFAQGRKHTETEKLRRLIEGKLRRLLQMNHARVDFAEKFERLIDEYNAGSKNIEDLFKELVQFARELTAEEQRAVAEGLSEEELALFDILTRPEPQLTKKEEAQVKAACRELLAVLKREKLVLDWREKQQTRAGVRNAIKIEFRKLPSPPYTRELQNEKLAAAFAHVFDAYTGAAQSVYH
jgi:type I restriction enzyme R subunit